MFTNRLSHGRVFLPLPQDGIKTDFESILTSQICIHIEAKKVETVTPVLCLGQNSKVESIIL